MILTKPASTDYDLCEPERGRFVLWSFPKGKWHDVLSVDDDDSDGEWLLIRSLCGKYHSTRYNQVPQPLFTGGNVAESDMCRSCLERLAMRRGWNGRTPKDHRDEN